MAEGDFNAVLRHVHLGYNIRLRTKIPSSLQLKSDANTYLYIGDNHPGWGRIMTMEIEFKVRET